MRDGSMEFSDGLVVVASRHEKKYNIRNVTYYNLKGEAAIQIPQISGGDDFSDGLAMISRLEGQRTTITFIDRQGRVVIGPDKGVYFAGPFSEGLAYVRTPRHTGYMDKEGKFRFYVKGAGQPFRNGRARVVLDGKIGFYNSTGKLLIDFRFAAAQDFADGLAPVKLAADGPWGYIDASGTVALKPQYHAASTFEHGVARVFFQKKEWGLHHARGQGALAQHAVGALAPRLRLDETFADRVAHEFHAVVDLQLLHDRLLVRVDGLRAAE